MYEYLVVLFGLIILSVSGQYNLSGSPQSVIAGEHITITLTCITAEKYVVFGHNEKTIIAFITGLKDGDCDFGGPPDPNYTYTCDLDNNMYRLYTNITITAEFDALLWKCGPPAGIIGESTFVFSVSVPVTKVTLTPTGDNDVVQVVEKTNKTFTCTTDTGRPAAWIQWYIGGKNVTNLARQDISPQTEMINSSSMLSVIGSEDDHNKTIYCEAVNIEGRNKIKSQEKLLYIQIPVKTVTITPSNDRNDIYVEEGAAQTFTCTTDASRPAAWIQWYIGDTNLTIKAQLLKSKSDDKKLISSSRLNYIGENDDHNKSIYCEAVNIEGKKKIKSTEQSIYIQVPVITVTIIPTGNKNVVDVKERATQTFTCITNLSRPAAWIQWYIGEQNATNQKQQSLPQQNGSMFISSSILSYTGKDQDHNKTVHCEAVNIENMIKVISTKKYIFIQIPVTTVTITPSGVNNLIDVVEGEAKQFTCTTDASRPAAWIQWYIGGKNSTNDAKPYTQQIGKKIISSSRLNYIGKIANHNKTIYCEAVNIDDGLKIKSTEKSFFIQIPVTTVTITTTSENNIVNVEEGKTQSFTCTTDASRPAATIQWFIGGQNVTIQAQAQNATKFEGKFISSSILNYTGHVDDHNKTVFCEAANLVEKQAVTSLDKTLFINFGPKNISLDTTKSEYAITEKNSIRTIICAATCRPNCTFNWSGPNGIESINYSLQLGPVYRNQSGKYICNARNDFGIRSSNWINIIVNYSPSIVKVKVNNETIENKSATFQCVVESRPESIITWKNSSSVLNTSFNVHQSNYTIENANCLQTGTYQCHAENIVDGKVQSTIAEIDFFVLCSVRHDRRKPSMPDKIGVDNDGLLNITEYLIAYPKPSIRWTFKNESITPNNSIGIFSHHTSILKWQIGNNEFGVYTLNASNKNGEPYVRTYKVFPQRKPTAPTNITVKCDIISMKVFWRSESNGGNKQTFKVLWWNQATNHTIFSGEIEDLGEGKYHSHTTNSLNPNTLYFVCVEATNSHGTVISYEHTNCTTKQKHTEEFLAVGSLVGGILGSICGVIVIAAVILIHFRRKNNSKDDREPIRRKKTFEVVDEDDDGLKDNPLYLSSAHASSVGNGPLYSIVHKQSKSESDTNSPENDDQGPVYSQVQKPDKKGRQERNDKKAKNHHKKEQYGDGIELGIANSEPRSNRNQNDGVLCTNSAEKDFQSSLTKNMYKPSKNKDGLIYADLDLAPGPTGKKFVIRGLENRNNYAIIDLTKTAEPLPSSDEDDEKENK